jgi:hypothetical protein
LDNAQRTRRLPVFLLSNTVHAIFGALATGTTLVLFYDELGLDKAEIGILGSLMHLLGPIVIFIAPLAARFGLKRTVILFYGTRKLVIILLALAPWSPLISAPPSSSPSSSSFSLRMACFASLPRPPCIHG